MIDRDALNLGVIFDSKGLRLLEMDQSIGKISGLELGQSKKTPGDAEIGSEPDHMLKRGYGVGELVGAVLEHPEIPPAFFPTRPRLEHTLVVANRLGGLPGFALLLRHFL